MDTGLITDIIKYLCAVLLGVLFGNGAVYLFNHMPAEWFCDYGESVAEKEKAESKPDFFGSAVKDISDPYKQRVRSYPWKYVFSMFFVAAGLYLVRLDWAFALASVFVLWILLELTISDIKYRIVPDQLIVLLAVSAVGFVQYHSSWKDMLYGAAAGLAIMGFTALLGKALYRRESVGGGDIKLFGAIGLILGLRGVLLVFALTALISGGVLVFLLAAGKIKTKDTIPMVPFIAASAAIYLIFVWQGPLGSYLETLSF